MSDPVRFGRVGPVFWIGRLGIAVRPYGPADGRRYDDLKVTAYRLWPFVFVWADH